MERAEKREVVTALHDVFAKTGVVVVAHYAGLSVADMTKLRSDMRDAGGQVKVAKNKLVKLALDGTDAKGISDLMTGPTCLAYSDDPVAAPKVLVKFAKANEKFVILGGTMGTTVLDAKGGEFARRTAFARRTPRHADWSSSGAGDEDRPHRERARRSAGACVRSLWQQGSSVTLETQYES